MAYLFIYLHFQRFFIDSALNIKDIKNGKERKKVLLPNIFDADIVTYNIQKPASTVK